MNVTSMEGITVELLPVVECLHCGPRPHRVGPDGSVDCMACLARPTRYALPREVRG